MNEQATTWTDELAQLDVLAAEVSRLRDIGQVPAADVDAVTRRIRALRADLGALAPDGDGQDRRIQEVRAALAQLRATWEREVRQAHELESELKELAKAGREATAIDYSALAQRAERLAERAQNEAARLRLSHWATQRDELEVGRAKLLTEAEELAKEYAVVTLEREHIEAEHEMPAERHIRRQRSLRHQITGRHRRSAELQRRIEELTGRLAAV